MFHMLSNIRFQKKPVLGGLEPRLRVRFVGRIRKRICDPRSCGFFDTKEMQNPKKDYFVMTRQAGGTQFIYIRYTSGTFLDGLLGVVFLVVAQPPQAAPF